MLGEEVFRYDPGHYLLFTVDLPLIFQIEKATPDEPYLGLRLDLDPSLVASVLMEADIKIKKGDASAKAMDVHSIDANLLDAVVRLVRLADEPGSSNVLAPLIVKEIIYRLLAGGQGARLGHLLPSGDTQRIAQAIGHLREHFDEPLKIDDIARQLGMSVSGFQVGHVDEPPTVSKAPPLAGSTTFDVRRRHGCRERRIPRGLRGPITFQPGV